MIFHRRLLLTSALMLAALAVSVAARAQIEGQCISGPCVCPDGRQSKPQACDFDCRGWCRGSDDGTSSGSVVPSPTVDPEQARLAAEAAARRQEEMMRAAEEARRLREEEIHRAQEAYQASYERRLALEREGRQLDADWLELERLIAMPPGSVPVDRAQLALIPLRRQFSPLGALPQARCIHFHLGLATAAHTVAAAPTVELPVPAFDPAFANAQLAHFEATHIFDTGQGMEGCDRAAVDAASVTAPPEHPTPPPTPPVLRLPSPPIDPESPPPAAEPDPAAELAAHCARRAKLAKRLTALRESLTTQRGVEELEAAERESWEQEMEAAAAAAWDGAPGLIADVLLWGLGEKMTAAANLSRDRAKDAYRRLRTLTDPAQREAATRAMRSALRDWRVIQRQLDQVVANLGLLKSALDLHAVETGDQARWQKQLEGLVVIAGVAVGSEVGFAKSMLDSAHLIATEIVAWRKIGHIRERQAERQQAMQRLRKRIDQTEKQLAETQTEPCGEAP